MSDVVTQSNKKKARRRKGKKWLVWVIVLALIIGAGVYFVPRFFGEKQTARGGAGAASSEYRTEQVQKRTLSSSLTGSGALQPANSYTVTTLAEGDILYCSFEEGDVVEKDAVLYRIDSSDAEGNIEKAQISLEQAQRNYENTVKKATVKTKIAGTVQELLVELGDEVSQGQQIALIRDSATMLLKVPFPSDDAVNFTVGQAAAVTLDGSFETLSGTVKKISGSDTVGTGNMITRSVTIAVKNPGGLGLSQTATAQIAGIGCAEAGTFAYNDEGTVTASASGTVTALYVSEGGWVEKDAMLLTLGGEDMEDTLRSAKDNLRNAELSMENTENILDNYTVKSPIEGTIVDKQYKQGDTVESGRTLCTIYDLSYLEMTMYIDELDISQVAVGQKVSVTADAVEGMTYEGEITKVSLLATTASGGAASYPVTVRIDESEGLRPGMNVDAEIILSRAEDALCVPSEAISRGGRVLITATSPSAKNATEQEAPEGYVYVQVETGLSDDTYTQILSGLAEGDTVAYTASSGNVSMMFPMGAMGMGGQMGGQMGGNRQQGNMGGGMGR